MNRSGSDDDWTQGDLFDTYPYDSQAPVFAFPYPFDSVGFDTDANGGTIDWGSGGDYDGNLMSCVTSSELTNTNGNSAPVGVAVSSGSQTPTEQAMYFLNGPGNDTFQGNANADSWSESRGNSLEDPAATPDFNAACGSSDFSSFANLYWANVAPLDNAGYSKT